MAKKAKQTRFTHRAIVEYNEQRRAVLLYATPKFWSNGNNQWPKDTIDPHARGDGWHPHRLITATIRELTTEERAAQTERERQKTIQDAQSSRKWMTERLVDIKRKRERLDREEQDCWERLQEAEKTLKDLGDA